MKGEKGYIYRIKLSLNMIQQGYGEYDRKEFENYDQAYNAVVGKWGSAVLNIPFGLEIQKKKIGTDDWVLVFNYGTLKMNMENNNKPYCPHCGRNEHVYILNKKLGFYGCAICQKSWCTGE